MLPGFPPANDVSNLAGFLPSPYTLAHSGTSHPPPPPQLSPYKINFHGAYGQNSKSFRPPPQAHHITASSGYHGQSRPLRVSGAPLDHKVDVYSYSPRTSVYPGHRTEIQPVPTSSYAPSRTVATRIYEHDRAASSRRVAAADVRDAVNRMVAERLSAKDADSNKPIKMSRSLLSRLIDCDDMTAITKIILSSPSKGLKMRSICKELESRYATLRGRNDWQVRVRYLLSQKNRFVRDNDVDEYEDNDDEGETMGGTWRVDLSLKGNRLRQGLNKSPVVQTKLTATAKSSHKSGMTKPSRPKNSTVGLDIRRGKASQAKKHEGRSPALLRTPPAHSSRRHRWYLDPLAKDNPHERFLRPMESLQVLGSKLGHMRWTEVVIPEMRDFPSISSSLTHLRMQISLCYTLSCDASHCIVDSFPSLCCHFV